MVIVCCTAIAAGGLASEGLFTSPATGEDVAAVAAALAASNCAALIPPGATPQLISSALKRWLSELPEPLLTFKLVPALTSADTPKESLGAILAELPPANHAALFLILETAHRIASNAAINDTDAAALAAALSPCLLWRDAAADGATAAPASPGAVARSQVLPADEEAEFVKLLSYMISHFRSLA